MFARYGISRRRVPVNVYDDIRTPRFVNPRPRRSPYRLHGTCAKGDREIRELFQAVSSIRDLARHLNISIGTVSRALNGRADVNAETRQRVLAAAAKLNYAPNQSGRNLRRGATHAVAFMLQPHPGDQQFGEPFFIPFLIGLQGKLAEQGLDLVVVMGAPGDYQQERLRRVVSRAGQTPWYLHGRDGRTNASTI